MKRFLRFLRDLMGKPDYAKAPRPQIKEPKRAIESISEIPVNDVLVNRERQPAEKDKISAMKDFLDLVASEDVDALFISLFTSAKGLGYSIKDNPEKLLKEIERQHAKR